MPTRASVPRSAAITPGGSYRPSYTRYDAPRPRRSAGSTLPLGDRLFRPGEDPVKVELRPLSRRRGGLGAVGAGIGLRRRAREVDLDAGGDGEPEDEPNHDTEQRSASEVAPDAARARLIVPHVRSGRLTPNSRRPPTVTWPVNRRASRLRGRGRARHPNLHATPVEVIVRSSSDSCRL
jgi:hypothetical protein